jgi:hypothetical protein
LKSDLPVISIIVLVAFDRTEKTLNHKGILLVYSEITNFGMKNFKGPMRSWQIMRHLAM